MCVRCAAHPALSLSLSLSFYLSISSIPHFLSPRGTAQWERSSIRAGCLLDERRKEGGREREREREREQKREGAKGSFAARFLGMLPPTDRKSGSHALCLFIFVPFRGTHGLSLQPTSPSLPPVPASGLRRRDDVFLLVEHASWLPVPSLVWFLVFFPLLRTLLFTYSCFL